MNKQELNFLFVGPQRTGTTWIYKHLQGHPSICFPRGVKETMFFDQNYKKGLDWYRWHFTENSLNQKCGEIAPTYFDCKDAPSRIKKHFPNCKIIISLRNPLEKARSLFQHHYQKGRVGRSFSEAVKVRPEILTSGYYKNHLERWFKYFNEDQILVISMEDIKNKPEILLDSLCDFLDIDNDSLSKSIKKEKVNTAQVPRFQILARIGSFIVTKLHSFRLHWFVNLTKRMGLKKFFSKKLTINQS